MIVYWWLHHARPPARCVISALVGIPPGCGHHIPTAWYVLFDPMYPSGRYVPSLQYLGTLG